MKAVRIIVTGGTLDKVHDPLTEGLAFSQSQDTQLPEILHQARCHFPQIDVLMMKDSLDFDAEDRQLLVDRIQAVAEQAIVITHGTSTMGETARFLEQRVRNKTVVLTGAMRPHSFGASDASFNLGGAISAAQLLAPGVWGVMNGRIFAAQHLEKNHTLGRFDM